MSVGFSERDMSLEYYFGRGGSADMRKYDADGDGVVDNAARLGGYEPSYFASAALVAGARVRDVTLDENGALVLLLEDGTRFVTDRVRGADGIDGKDGKDGHTPQKGVDYFTEAEVEAIVASVAARVSPYSDRGELIATATLGEEGEPVSAITPALIADKRYYIEGKRFVARHALDDFMAYVSPPNGLRFTGTDDTEYEVSQDPSEWYVSAVVGKHSEGLTLHFYAVAGEDYREKVYEKGEVVATFSEEQILNGTDGAFLEIGERYFIGDTCFVAEAGGGSGYPAPRSGLMVRNGDNAGVVSHDGDTWFIHWDNAPDPARSVTFYRAVEVTP